MDEITTKKQDAESIIGELANELEEKSIASDMLVVRSDENGSAPVAEPSEITSCYDPNTGGWNDDCIRGVMDKYMPQIRNEIGVPVKSTTWEKPMLDVVVAQIYKSNGYEVPVVEDAMEEPKVEKAVEEVPAKAEVKDEKPEEEKKEEKKEMSATEKAFKSLMDSMNSKNPEDAQRAFAELGTEVEKAFAPEPKAFDPNDLAAIVKSAVEDVVAPLRIEIATLKAQRSAASPDGVAKSKALNLNPSGMKIEDIVKRSAAHTQPTRKLSQIEMLARKSTGAQLPE